mmetsp:Transcript_20657/g.57915  ORF Transcript_20657/g.57915 Transcript_20657/m.57915 type:complete len:210 (+) Transcript_20657:468-1097(+)
MSASAGEAPRSRTTPRSSSGSTSRHRITTGGSSMACLQSMIFSSGATRFPSITRELFSETVRRRTSCSTAPVFSSAAGASDAWSRVHPRIMAAARSPVPAKEPSMRGRRSSHFDRCASDSIMATDCPPQVASGISIDVIMMVFGPSLCSASHAAAASARLLILVSARSSASNWFGVSTDTCGSTSARYMPTSSSGTYRRPLSPSTGSHK